MSKLLIVLCIGIWGFISSDVLFARAPSNKAITKVQKKKTPAAKKKPTKKTAKKSHVGVRRATNSKKAPKTLIVTNKPIPKPRISTPKKIKSGVVDPVIDSSQLQADTIEINAKPITQLFNRTNDKVLTDSNMTKIANRVSNEIENISAAANEEIMANHLPSMEEIPIEHEKKKDPKESIKLRQELDKYRKMFSNIDTKQIQA